MTMRAEPVVIEGERARASLRDLVALTKPRITAMVLFTMLGGIALARRAMLAQGRETPSASRLAAGLVGTVLVVGGANALNMYLERDTDAKMTRTKDRPLPAGRMAPDIALAVGMILSVASIPLLTFCVNALTGLLAGVALVSYVLVYTPLKRASSVALLVGAVPGAIPPLLGWTAVTGACELPGLLLFAVLFFWQVPHFLAISLFRKAEYAKAGLVVLPNEHGDEATRKHMVLFSIALLVVTILLFVAGVGGLFYLASAIVLGAAFVGAGARGLVKASGDPWAKKMFFGSILYLVLLLAALVASP